VVPHISLVALDRGMTTGQAASIAAAYGLSTIIGRVLVGALADRFFVPRVAMIFFACSGLGFVLAALFGGSGSVGVLMLVALTIGLGFGAESDVIALFITRYFGQRCFGAIYGLLLAVFLIGASVGPALFGYGRDLSGGYGAPMLAGAVVMSMACLMLSRLGAYPAAFANPAQTAALPVAQVA
jgi:MFS family permease